MRSVIRWTATVLQAFPSPVEEGLNEYRHELTGVIEMDDWIELPDALRSIGLAVNGALGDDGTVRPAGAGLGDRFRIGIGIEYGDAE